MTPADRNELRAIVMARAVDRTHYDDCWKAADHRDCAILRLLDHADEAGRIIDLIAGRPTP